MATRSIIAKLDDKGIQAIYCHNDGYLSNNGKKLDLYYTDNTDEQDAKDKVNELLAGGDISSLKDTIEDTTFYHRDKNEPYSRVKAVELKNETKLAQKSCYFCKFWKICDQVCVIL